MANPKLRFKADDGSEFQEWEGCELSKFAYRVTRINKNNESNIPLTISAEHGLINQLDFFNKKIASKDMSKYYLLKKGEFAYNKSYSKGFDFGVIKRLNAYEQGALSRLYICFAVNGINPRFLEHFFDSLRWYANMSTICQEGARNHGLLNCSVSDFFNMELSVPCLEEQQKIADFLSTFDSKVESKEQQLASLKELKKGFLHKIFSQELRFKADDGSEFPEWEYCYFEDVADGFNYGLGASAKEFDGLNTYIRITDIDDDSRLFKIDGRMSPSQLLEKGLVQKNDILMARTGNSVGKTFIYSGGLDPLYFAGYLIRIRVKEAFCPKFIFYTTLSSKFIEWVSTESSRSAQRGLNAEQYRSYRFSCPCLEEQRKIADFLSAFDAKIEAVEQQVEALKEIKKGLLQQLFA